MDDPTAQIDAHAEQKAALRTRLRAARTAHVESLPAAVRGIAFHMLPSPALRKIAHGASVALYFATGHEAPTANIAVQLDDLGYRLCLPRLDRDTGAMDFAAWDMDRILVPGPFRTLQPDAAAASVAPDAIIAPLVGFDAALNRLGQGGGYYDRAFAAHPGALRIGLAWSVQKVDQVPVDGHDRPLDMVVTEAAIWEKEEGAR
ncbi:MAG: 5-formyltetrahydrofolate cyclo-ligase [Sphingobium sp.]